MGSNSSGKGGDEGPPGEAAAQTLKAVSTQGGGGRGARWIDKEQKVDGALCHFGPTPSREEQGGSC